MRATATQEVEQGFTGSHERTDKQGITIMKRFALFTGFLLLTTAVAVPFYLLKKAKAFRQEEDNNIRYDIDDYIAAESL